MQHAEGIAELLGSAAVAYQYVLDMSTTAVEYVIEGYICTVFNCIAPAEADEQRQQLAAADRYVAAAKTTILNCRREATVARSQVAAAQEELAAARRQIAELQMAINIGQTPQ